jgi:hypothetical protein
MLGSSYLMKQGYMGKKMNRPQQTGWAFIKGQRGAPTPPPDESKNKWCMVVVKWSLSREGGGKKGHYVAGSRKGEQVSGWVKCAILQVVQWFRGGEEF